MDFSQFLLHESYKLSPYKICVANFICSFMEHRHYLDSLPYDPATSLDISGHGHLTYKLIMLMDCSFEELNQIIITNDPPVCQEVLGLFQKENARLKRLEIKHFFDFMGKIRMFVHKKIFKNRQNDSMNDSHPHSSSSLASYNQIHKMSLVGVFLRELILHFERLSYCETATLFEQLQSYLTGKPDPEHNGSLDPEDDEEESEIRSANNADIEQLKSEVNLSILEELESRVNKNSESNLFLQHLASLIRQTRSEIENGKDQSEQEQKGSLAEKEPEKHVESMETESSPTNKLPDNSSAMDIDLTLNDTQEKEMSLDRTVFDHRPREPDTEEINFSKTPLDVDVEKPMGKECVMKKRPLSQHCLFKQIYKIQYNEKLAMSPQKVMMFIQRKFSHNNSFYYLHFIAFNYMANLNLARDHAALHTETKTSSSMPNGVPNAADGNMSNTPGPNPGGNMMANGSTNTGTGIQSLFRSINFVDDIEFLKYINSLRINDYTLAKKAFFDYFDLKKPGFEPENDSMLASNSGENSSMNNTVGNNLPNNNIPRQDGHTGGANVGAGTGHVHHHPDRNSSRGDASNRATDGRTNIKTKCSNYCWSALNLAMMFAHFQYYRLAYDALVDCLSLARDKRDEHCLQYAMLWILEISQHLDHSKPGENPKKKKVYVDLDFMESIIGLILTNPATMPYISAKAFLHLFRLHYLKPGPLVSEQMSLSDMMDSVHGQRSFRSPLLPFAFYWGMKYRLYDILGETFSIYSAILNAYGANHMACTYSQLWLRMDVSEMVMDERVMRLDENAAIAVRNMAHYLYFFRGDFFGARDLIQNFRRNFTIYNQQCQRIMERALIEIIFDRNVSIGKWNVATKCLNAILCVDSTKSYFMLAELKRRKNQPLEALECLDLILGKQGQSQSFKSKLSGSPFFHQEDVQSTDQNSDEENDGQDQNESVLVREKERSGTQTTSQTASSISMCGDDPNILINSSRPMHLVDVESENMAFFERIQPPPPEELEPKEKRPLIPELDPYMSLECNLMRGIILDDLSILFECVALSLSYGFKQMECRSLIQIARIQSEKFGQHSNGREIIEAVLHRVYSQGTLRDLATTLYIYASILYRMNMQQKTSSSIEKQSETDETEMVLARKLAKRSVWVWQRIQDRHGLIDSLRLVSLICHATGETNWRNYYAKRARTVAARML